MRAVVRDIHDRNGLPDICLFCPISIRDGTWVNECSKPDQSDGSADDTRKPRVRRDTRPAQQSLSPICSDRPVGAHTLNFLDRQILAILAEPIKQDLGFQDWQLGLLTGLAFALFYTILGIPIASLSAGMGQSPDDWSWQRHRGVERVHRIVRDGPELLATGPGARRRRRRGGRVHPARHFADHPITRRPRNVHPPCPSTCYGAPLGALIGMAAGGLIADTYGWRMAFLIAGAPASSFHRWSLPR